MLDIVFGGLDCVVDVSHCRSGRGKSGGRHGCPLDGLRGHSATRRLLWCFQPQQTILWLGVAYVRAPYCTEYLPWVCTWYSKPAINISTSHSLLSLQHFVYTSHTLNPFGCPVKCLIEGKELRCCTPTSSVGPNHTLQPGLLCPKQRSSSMATKETKATAEELQRIPAMPRPFLGSQPPLVLGQGRKGREEKGREGEGRSQRYHHTVRNRVLTKVLTKHRGTVLTIQVLTVLSAVRAHQAHGTRALFPVQKNRGTDGSHRQRREKECKDSDRNDRSSEKRGKAFADMDPRRDSG